MEAGAPPPGAGAPALLEELTRLLGPQPSSTLQRLLDLLHREPPPASPPPHDAAPEPAADSDRSPVPDGTAAGPLSAPDPVVGPAVLVTSPSFTVQPPLAAPTGGPLAPPEVPHHLQGPHPRDLDITDPTSLENSVTSIHRSIDYGYDLSQLPRSTSSLSSLLAAEEMMSPTSSERPRSVSPLPRDLSSAIFHRRLAFRAKKEEFYPETDREPLVLITVGLPARGKSYVARRLCRYLGWKGVPCRIFNAGSYRRNLLGNEQPQHSDFFDANNEEGKAVRERMAHLAAEDLIEYIRQGGQVGILDATNTTRARRRHVLDLFTGELGLPVSRVIFLEMVCHDRKIVEHNIIAVKLRGKDYENVDPTAAYEDFRRRETEYLKVYETLDLDHPEDAKISFLKLVDAGESLVTHRILGALPRSLVQFSSFLTPFAGHLYVTVAGETDNMMEGRLGMNSDLSPRGRDFARHLEAWTDRLGHETMHVWCAPTNAGTQTARPFLKKPKKYHVQVWRALMDIDYGNFQGKTYEEVRDQHPGVWSELQRDEYFYAWPGGESPCSVVQRLDPVLMAIEGKTAPILLICSRTVCRALLSYCCDLIPEQFTRIQLPRCAVFDIDMNAEPIQVVLRHVGGGGADQSDGAGSA
jgi:broad specificity phosphatase PhoE/predicted kinase